MGICYQSKTLKEVVEERDQIFAQTGYAYGLGKPVIHTCKDSDEAKRRTHFDVEQYNTIFWRSDELALEMRDVSTPIENPTLAERLAVRILAIVGRGTYTAPSQPA